VNNKINQSELDSQNIQPVSIAGKHTTNATRGKTCNGCQARENLQRVPSAGKHATDAKRGKTCNGYQARENMQLMPSTGNLVMPSGTEKCV